MSHLWRVSTFDIKPLLLSVTELLVRILKRHSSKEDYEHMLRHVVGQFSSDIPAKNLEDYGVYNGIDVFFLHIYFRIITIIVNAKL